MISSILYDLAAVLILALFSWFGHKRGFIKTLTNTLSLVLSFFITSFFVDLIGSVAPKDTTFIIALIISYVLISLLLSILMKAINLVAKLPIISSLNKLLGFVCGLLFGLLIIMAVGYYLVVSGTIPAQDVADTFVFNFIWENSKIFLG